MEDTSIRKNTCQEAEAQRQSGTARNTTASEQRGRARRRELILATHNVRTMAVDGKHGVGREAEVLSAYQEVRCDIVGLQETRRSGQLALLQAGYIV